MKAEQIGLWKHPNFMKLWMGSTISQFGSQISSVAFPLLAVVYLHANAGQMGILGALGMLPFLLIGLFAGVYVDRFRRRPLLILADFARLILVGLIPLLYVFHSLAIWHLYIITFLTGCMTVVFDLAYQSYLPAVVPREALVDGNSKLEVSRAASQIAGPSLGGFLVQILSAPVTMLADSVSYLASVLSLLRIRGDESKPAVHRKQGMWTQIGEGLQFVFRNRILWSIAGCTSTSNFFGSITSTVYMLYLVHQLDIPASLIGVIYGVGSIGALLGAFVAKKWAVSIGLGWTIITSITVSGMSRLLIPLTPHLLTVAIVFLITAEVGNNLGGTVYNINQVSLRQAITPNRLLGRMNASVRFIIWGSIPLGSLIGGWLGTHLGIDVALWIGAIGGFSKLIWLLFSPVPALKSPPTPITEDAVVAH